MSTCGIKVRTSFIQSRFYLTGDMTNLYQFIQGSLEWPFSELLSANVSLWNQYKSIAFRFFSCRILIVSYKMLIITGIFNEKTNESTIYRVLCRNVTIFYRQELASLFQVQEKFKPCRNSKLNFSSSCFNVNDSHVKIVWPIQRFFGDTVFWSGNLSIPTSWLLGGKKITSFNTSDPLKTYSVESDT